LGTGLTRGSAGPTVDDLMDLAKRFYVDGQSQISIARSLGLDPQCESQAGITTPIMESYCSIAA
jgi:hypothetical protein